MHYYKTGFHSLSWIVPRLGILRIEILYLHSTPIQKLFLTDLFLICRSGADTLSVYSSLDDYLCTCVAFPSCSFSNYGENFCQNCIITNHDNTICKHSKRNNKWKVLIGCFDFDVIKTNLGKCRVQIENLSPPRKVNV